MFKWLFLICLVVITVSVLLQGKVNQVTRDLPGEASGRQEAVAQFPAVIGRSAPVAAGVGDQKHLTPAEEQLSGRVAPVQEKSGPGQILAQ
jgi:hypothetical protein